MEILQSQFRNREKNGAKISEDFAKLIKKLSVLFVKVSILIKSE